MSNEKLFPEIEGFSLFGEPLFQIPLVSDVYDKQEELYDEALKNYKHDSSNPTNLIWLGRRAAYLGRLREAISIFTMGVKKFPEDARLYRHRGHRFITLRQFDLAISDLEKAAQLIEGKEDALEPDGMPNLAGIQVSSLHTNIWYHLGLVYYLKGEFERSLEAYMKGLTALDLNDNYVSCAHWIYMILRLLDREDEAKKILEKVDEDMEIIENQYYHKCLLMYKGKIEPEKLMEIAKKEGELGIPAIAYAVANWYYYNGKIEEAISINERILSMENWATFGYIAAEADLKRFSKK